MTTRRPAYVVLHPGDDPSRLPSAFFGHPDTFEPRPCPLTGLIERWGIVDDTEDADDGMSFIKGLMTAQSMYGFGRLKKPEEQFVDALIAKKVAVLEAAREAAAPFYRRDYILDIDLAPRVITEQPAREHQRLSPRVWRRVRVSGGVPLSALSDKVIAPVMGWTRNYHAHVWTDHRDGTLFGDPESGAIDAMHIDMHFHALADEGPWRLGDLLQEEGQLLSYMYDIGDCWRHVIRVVRILPQEESTGRMAVLDGAMACPPEDSKGLENSGSGGYQEFLDQLGDPAYRRSSDYRQLVREASAALNYRDRRAPFDPEAFSLGEAQAALAAALGSRASVASGAKQFCVPMMPGLGGSPLWGDGLRFSAKCALGPSPCGVSAFCFPSLQETVATGKDPRRVAVCSACGNPNQLMSCAGCQLVRFCNRECQLQAWTWHKKECKEEQRRRAAAAKGGSGSGGSSSSGVPGKQRAA
ncbi:hypothetical protein ABPG75_006746 [Micractinium tetrahymenae]